MKYVVSYDIEKDKKRNKIAKILGEFGVRVQYSVFECKISKDEMHGLTKRLEALLNVKTDSILFYPQCQNCDSKKLIFGTSYLEKRVSVIEI